MDEIWGCCLASGYDGYRTCTGAGRGWIQGKGTQTTKTMEM